MRCPQPAEEYIIVVSIVDNKGRERFQHVEYIVTDVRGDTVYVTADGLAYTRDSLARKAHYSYFKESPAQDFGILRDCDLSVLQGSCATAFPCHLRAI